MSEKEGTLYWHTGGGGSPHTATICDRDGTSGRDDPTGQGRVALFPYSWPDTISQDNSLYAHVMSPGTQGPHGETVHHDKLNGMKCTCTMMPDGTPLIHTTWPTWTGAETSGWGGATGESVYPTNSTEKG